MNYFKLLYLFWVCTFSYHCWADELTLTPHEATEIALKNNHSLRSLEFNMESLRYKIKEAWGRFSPQLSLKGMFNRLDKAQDFGLGALASLGIPGMPTNTPDRDMYNVGLQLAQPLFMGFKLYNGLKAAKLGLIKEQSRLDNIRRTIKYTILQLYWTLYNLQENLKVTRESINQLRRLSQDQQMMFNKGLIAQHDLLKVKANLSQAILAQIKVKKMLGVLQRSLAILLGKDPSTKIILTGTPKVPITLSNIEQVMQKSMQSRPDLMEMRTTVEIMKINEDINRSSYLPNITFLGNYNWDKPNENYEYDSFKKSWNIMITMQMNLWDGGKGYFATQSAKRGYLMLKETLKQQEKEVKKDVLDAHHDLLEAKAELIAAEENLMAWEKNHLVLEQKLAQGMATMFEYLSAQSTLTSAKQQVIEAKTNLQLAYIKFEMGGVGKMAGTASNAPISPSGAGYGNLSEFGSSSASF